MSHPTVYNDPSAGRLIQPGDSVTYYTGYRQNVAGQRTWWVFCRVTGMFPNAYALLGAMIESVARGRASLAPNWDNTVAGGIWYDFDCSADILNTQQLMGVAMSDMQRRIETYMYARYPQTGSQPSLGFR